MSNRTITVRDAIVSDQEKLKEILLDAYGQYEQTLTQERWELYKGSILSSVTDAPTKARLVAEIAGQIVGSVFLFDSAEAAYGSAELNIHTPIIRLLAVSQNARGLGVATELIRASALRSLEWGAHTLHLHTSDMMQSAVKLYERLGFERAHDKEFMNGDLLVKSYRLHLKESSFLQLNA